MTTAELQQEVVTTRDAIIDLLVNLAARLPEGFVIESCNVYVCTPHLPEGGFGPTRYEARIGIEVAQ